jgi:hypothetical protein
MKLVYHTGLSSWKLRVEGLLMSVFIMGCLAGSNSAIHNDPSGLLGTWDNIKMTNFIIAEVPGEKYYTFSCDILLAIDPAVMKVTTVGELHWDYPDLGPNEYVLEPLTTSMEPGDPNAALNSIPSLKSMIEAYSGLLATITLSNNNNQFEFTSRDPAADMLFGGAPYTRVINL